MKAPYAPRLASRLLRLHAGRPGSARMWVCSQRRGPRTCVYWMTFSNPMRRWYRAWCISSAAATSGSVLGVNGARTTAARGAPGAGLLRTTGRSSRAGAPPGEPGARRCVTAHGRARTLSRCACRTRMCRVALSYPILPYAHAAIARRWLGRRAWQPGPPWRRGSRARRPSKLAVQQGPPRPLTVKEACTASTSPAPAQRRSIPEPWRTCAGTRGRRMSPPQAGVGEPRLSRAGRSFGTRQSTA